MNKNYHFNFFQWKQQKKTLNSEKTKFKDPNSGGSFNECSSLVQIIIPSSVTSIGDYAFSKCTSLARVTFETPSSVKSIGNGAFRRFSSLAEIAISPYANSIECYTFADCSSLARITISSSVTWKWRQCFQRMLAVEKNHI